MCLDTNKRGVLARCSMSLHEFGVGVLVIACNIWNWNWVWNRNQTNKHNIMCHNAIPNHLRCNHVSGDFWPVLTKVAYSIAATTIQTLWTSETAAPQWITSYCVLPSHSSKPSPCWASYACHCHHPSCNNKRLNLIQRERHTEYSKTWHPKLTATRVF